MSKTRILDATLATLRGSPAARRAPRKAQVQLEVWAASDTYTITANGKTLETGEGTPDYAKQRADDRAAAVRCMGKTVVVYVH